MEIGERTGRPRGRPLGAKNKRNKEFQAEMVKAHELVEAALPESLHGDAHTLLMVTYKDVGQILSVRLYAAKAATRFEKPALAGTHQTNAYDLSKLTDEQFEQLEAIHETLGAGEDHPDGEVKPNHLRRPGGKGTKH